MSENLPFFTVSRISEIIKNTIEQTFPIVGIVGEVSNLSISAKYAFFSLKDDDALIKCVCWSPSVEVKSVLKDGEKVIVNGKITAYKTGSYYQVTAYRVKSQGVGNLAQKFEELKNKLQKEGIFDEKHKKPLPKYIQSVAVISAKNSAAIEDVFKVFSQSIVKNIYFIPAIMQGVDCANSVVLALQKAHTLPIQAILIARGGGSFEDLSQFNNEVIVREVFAAKVPIISAIGHETDFTILDFVADIRASTPTYGAKMIAIRKSEALMQINSLNSRILQKIQFEVMQMKNTVRNLEQEIKHSTLSAISFFKQNLNLLKVRLSVINFLNFVRKKMGNVLLLEQKFEQINPQKALKRGFVLLKSGENFENNPKKLHEKFEVVTHFGNFPAQKRSS